MRVKWAPVVEQAAGIVESYDTGVTLRQLFYRLVAAVVLPNLQSYYRRLSAESAKARRDGTFPDLLDQTSRIEEPVAFTGPAEAQEFIRNLFRRDRTEGQPWTIILGVEKAGMSAQLDTWFTDPLGIPHVALGGYASQTLADAVRHYVVEQERPAVLIDAGDHDPTGEDIDRDFEARVGVFDKVVRVALSAEQVERYQLPFNPNPDVVKKLEDDPRAGAFVRRHGSLVQYEMDALDPEELRNLYRRAVEQFWDESAFEAAMEREEHERDEL